VPVREALERTFGVPVFVEHDARAGALGERWMCHARESKNFIFISLGTGVGAGLFLDGDLYRGHHYAAGEIGNMLMGRKNLDKRVGSKAIKRRARGLTAASARAVLYHPDSARLATKVADEVATAVINISSVVDPELVVFGGGTSTDALIDRVRERVERELFFPPRLIRSALDEQAQLYGATWGALKAAGRTP
jgi:predicted NBD/HSP70 family sugar kinase